MLESKWFLQFCSLNYVKLHKSLPLSILRLAQFAKSTTRVKKQAKSEAIKLKLALDNGIYLVRITNKNTNETIIKKLIINR